MKTTQMFTRAWILACSLAAIAAVGCGDQTGSTGGEGQGADATTTNDTGATTGGDTGKVGTDSSTSSDGSGSDVASNDTGGGTDAATSETAADTGGGGDTTAAETAEDTSGGSDTAVTETVEDTTGGSDTGGTVDTADSGSGGDTGGGDTGGPIEPTCTPEEFAKLSAKGDFGTLLAASASSCASAKSADEFSACLDKAATGAGIDAQALKLCVCPSLVASFYKDCVVAGGDAKACVAAKLANIKSLSDLKAACGAAPTGCKSDAECLAIGACNAGKCDAGVCKVTPLSAGSACSDGSACTTADACDGKGVCAGGAAVTCDDKNPCTADKCDPASGCTAAPDDGAACDDGNACTAGDACKGGACQAGTPSCACKVAADCDDKNPCTTDSCDAGACKSAAAADGGACNDGDVCTSNDACAAGKCAGQALVCDDGNPCTTDKCQALVGCVTDLNDGAPCDDKSDCTKGDSCQAGVCAPGVYTCACKADSDCDDKDVCTADKCDAGKCGNKAVADGAPCSDGDACTDKDACKGGACAAGAIKTCDDGNPCTVDSCDLKTGCKVTNLDGAPCDDGAKCTDGDACKDGKCQAGGKKVCDDKNACTDDSCDDAKGCVATNNAAKCDDGNACTTTDACDAGACAGSGALACDDKNPCTADKCDPTSGCAPVPDDGAACDDGNICTSGDTCKGGACKAGAPSCACQNDSECDDKNPCTTDTCTANACKNAAAADGGACSDGDACTEKDACTGGKCAGSPVKCDDGNPCTVEKCTALNGCVTDLADGAPCDDKEACTTGDSCQAGKCAPGAYTCACKLDADCDDKEACTVDKCVSGKCVNGAVPDGNPCDDGNACSEKDSCKSGSCAAGTPKVCDDKNLCTADSCDAKTGCKATPTNGAPCDDDSKCTSGDACQDGKCAGGAKVVCDDKNVCTDDSCDPAKGCANVANAGACDDSNVCTEGDKCKDGSCAFDKVKACDDNNPCTDDTCDPKAGGCLAMNNSDPCDDGSLCTEKDACQNGKCAPGTPLKCDDGNLCTDDSCDPKTGCTALSNTTPCDDKDLCTEKDVCKDGKCAGGPATVCDDKNVCTDDACNPASGCYAAPNKDVCDDANPCTGDGQCADGKCGAGKPISCDDGSPCTADSCDKATGKCVYTPQVAPCDDGDACTLKDACQNGKCTPGTTTTCDDKKECTSDVCDPKSGQCVFTPIDDTCEDGNLCTIGDKCGNGACLPGAATVCDDGNACTTDSCDKVTGKCVVVNVADKTACNDDDACTSADVCMGGKCQGGAKVPCSDGNECTTDGCDAKSGCTFLPLNAVPCSDGTVCTVNDACVTGKCEPGKPLVCGDDDPCTTNACDAAKGCLAIGQPKCAYPIPSSFAFGCTDSSNVNWALGSAGKNVWAFDALPNPPGAFSPGCSLNFNDNKDYTCSAGQSSLNASAISPPFDATGVDASLNMIVKFQLSGVWETGPWDNLDLETSIDGGLSWKLFKSYDHTTNTWNLITEKIPGIAGKVFKLRFRFHTTDCMINNTSGAFLDDLKVSPDGCSADAQCNDSNVCTVDKCVAFKCTYSNAADGGKCSDNNVCTLLDTCKAGVCAPGALDPCDDKNECTKDTCDAKLGCAHAAVADASPCNDGNACTTEACKGGTCTPAPIKCDDGNVCTLNNCDTKTGCVYPAVTVTTTCNDGSACTDKDTCTNGKCGGTTITCDDGDYCSTDTCNVQTGCVFTVKTGCAYPLPQSTAFPCNPATKSLWTLGASGNVAWNFDATPTPPGAAGGTGCALNVNNGTNFVCSGVKTINAAAITPKLDATAVYAVTDVIVSFKLAGTWESGSWDNLDLDVSTNGGSSWTNVTTYDGNSLTYATVTETIKGLGGTTFQLRFRFWGTNCAENNGTGAFIDDLSVTPKYCKADADCDDKQTCTTEVCDATKQCKYTSLQNGAKCDDGSACTKTDVCATAKCVGLGNGCDDGNSCSLDSCVAGTTCAHTAATGAPCHDGNVCTVNDKCNVLSKCAAGVNAINGAACTDDNPCTTENCQNGVCAAKNVVDKTPCGDGDACTIDVCMTGKCNITAVNCSDGDPCTTDNACDKVNGCTYSYVGGCKNALPYSQAFGCNSPKNLGWTLGKSNTPVWAIDASPAAPGPYGGTGCSLNYNNGFNFLCGTGVTSLNASATSPLIDATAVAAPKTITIGFRRAGSWETGSSDNLDVEISTNGVTWSLLQTFDGTGNLYTSTAITTSAPIGKVFQVRFRFWTTDCFGNNGAGPHIDDLYVIVTGSAIP